MLQILTLPSKSLHERSTEVDHVLLSQASTHQFINDLLETMHLKDGVGLAAPQVGKNIRICVINSIGTKEVMDEKHQPTINHDLVLINPIWQKISRKQVYDLEGCLSVPKIYGKVKRYKDIVVKATDIHGKEIKIEAHGFFARVIQHEVDHLDGVLFIEKAKDLFREKENNEPK